MNRLEASPLSVPSSSTPHASKPTTAPLLHSLFTDGVADSFGGAGLGVAGCPPATTFTPIHYEEGYAYPLLVWLHGDGQSDRELPTVMTHISMRNYVAAAPLGERAAAEPCRCCKGGDDRGWCGSPDAVASAGDRVAAAIDTAAERFNIRHDRVFLAGVGSGGTAALRLGLADPGRFAGVASFDGPMPLGGQPLRSVTRVRRLPMLLGAAQASLAYPQARFCEDLRLLHTAGCQVNVRQYPGDDELTTTMLSDLDEWMMAIVCGGR